jgi:dethiobiotin synthetase
VHVRRLFITAAGTDVGKTFVAVALLHALRARGRKAQALKPVASGFDPEAAETSDTGRLLLAQERGLDATELDAVSPWRFRAPLSPDMAAAREGRRIDFDELVQFSAAPPADPSVELTLVEGIGGLMVPLDDRHTVLDWLDALDCAVLLVTGSYLGTLSHTLTAASALATRNRVPIAIVVSESAAQPVSAEETAAVLRRFVAPTRVAVLRRQPLEQAAKSDTLRDILASVLDR